ncbi:MAG: hypothetical protein LCI00_33605 [Chloroflexi bacterium]|nr:hypothetical protein [Chloroflexota bacterium]MCC6894040.1 hypothetical protein [Anaerolineae bacterium]
MKEKRFVIALSIVVIVFAIFSLARSIANEKTGYIPTPTEASGGIIGTGVDELRCPQNLSGIGPTWKDLTIGVSLEEDLAKYFQQEAIQVTPYPPYSGSYAPNYKFEADEFGIVYACIVGDKTAALLLDRHAASNSGFPASVEQWVAFLGIPEMVSWHQQVNMRVLHWPQYGISITAYLYDGVPNAADTEWIYMYPFRDTNYKTMWPINSIWREQPFALKMPDVRLEVLDFEAIEATVMADTLWPTVTPHTTEQP